MPEKEVPLAIGIPLTRLLNRTRTTTRISTFVYAGRKLLKPVDILSNFANLSVSHIGQGKSIGGGIKALYLRDLRLASTDAQKQMNLVGKILLKR